MPITCWLELIKNAFVYTFMCVPIEQDVSPQINQTPTSIGVAFLFTLPYLVDLCDAPLHF